MSAIIKNIKLKQSKTALSTPKKQKEIYQAYTIWFSGKAIQRKITLKNHSLQSCTFGK